MILPFTIAVLAIPGCAAAALFTGEWRWLLASGAAYFIVRAPT